MNPSFEKALAIRFQCYDAMILSHIGGFDDEADACFDAAINAAHELASEDVLSRQYYGPRAPLLFVDIPDLAEQYNLAHELYTELYYKNHHAKAITHYKDSWLAPLTPLPTPYSEWTHLVQARIDGLTGYSEPPLDELMQVILEGWSLNRDIESIAADAFRQYELNESEAHLTDSARR